ncbi:MAG TPA: hypothetical protein VGP07_17415 [Polyangia bacterium]|jgi:hypothetical protein
MPDGGAPRNGARNSGNNGKAKASGARVTERTKGRPARAKTEARAPRESWVATLTRQTQEHPGRTVALAVGAGFVLGGGLFSRLSMRVAGAGLRIAVRAAMVPAIRQGVVALAEDLLRKTADDRADGAASEAPATSAPTSVAG